MNKKYSIVNKLILFAFDTTAFCPNLENTLCLVCVSCIKILFIWAYVEVSTNKS